MRQGFECAVRVECSAGHRREAEADALLAPRRAHRCRRDRHVWLGTDHRYFEIRADEGACYIPRNDMATGHWG